MPSKDQNLDIMNTETDMNMQLSGLTFCIKHFKLDEARHVLLCA